MIWLFEINVVTLHRKSENGAMSEWLGKGLQNLVHQFESGWHLQKPVQTRAGFFI